MLFNIYFPPLKVLAVPNFPTRRDTWYLFYTCLLGIISGITQNAIFFTEGSASAICLNRLSQLAYLPIACTENSRPTQHNPTALSTNTSPRSEPAACRLPSQAPESQAFSAL